MPFGDGTGPAGFGSVTGRGMGYCTGHRVAGFQNAPGYGRGLGRRDRAFARGFRRGYRHFPYSVPANSYYNPPYKSEIDREEKVEYLKETARALEGELDNVKKELKNLEDNND